MRTYTYRDYRLLSCWECFDACGRICKNKNNDAIAPQTASFNAGHGVCCRPDSQTEFCTATDDYICSDPSYITNY